MTGDDEVFEELQRLVFPPLREPPAESVAALHAAVARQFKPNATRPWWQQKVAVGAAVFGLIAGAPAGAFAISGAPLPDPLRTAVHAMGLPVDSVPVADTKTAEADLEHALRGRDQMQIQKAAGHLQACLSDLDGAERSRLGAHADALLAQAVADTNEGARTTVGPSDDKRSEGDPSGGGGSTSDGDNSGPTSGSSVSNGSSEDGSNQTSGGSGRSGDGDQTTALPGSSTPTTTTDVGSTSGDGDQPITTTTTAPVQGQSEDGATTTTTVQSGGSGDGSGGSEQH